MPDATIPNRNPPDPADPYPLREYDVALNDLVGWTRAQVLARLGEPNGKSEGRTWSGGEGLNYKTYVRNYSGEIQELYVFGIVPQTIPVGAPYETWIYHNVRGTTWLLFFVEQIKSPPQVVEVGQYPTGAVF